MRALRWFSGSSERRERAIFLINQLLEESGNKISLPLYEVLNDYRNELEFNNTSISYTLTRMNIDISRVLMNNAIQLTEFESSKLKDLRKLLYTRTPFVKLN